MRSLHFRIVNVFADSALAGNPLCVFDDSSANQFLTDVEMQALALQFNLSETTFVLPASEGSGADARIRIFTPSFEMAFAGHPTLGSAHVIREAMATGDSISLEMKAGLIPVVAMGSRWELSANPPSFREFEHPPEELAAMLGLASHDLLGQPRWVSTGSEQLIVPLASVDAVRRAEPVAELLRSVSSDIGRSMAYVFAADPAREPDSLYSRFFFMKQASVVEDPGTGSATANLGGWMLAEGLPLPLSRSILQGEQMLRPCHIGLRVDADRRIHVSGNVLELASGTVTL